MLNRQNERLTNYEDLGLYNRPSSAYGNSPLDSRWNRDNTHNYRPRSTSTYNADQYDSSNLGHLAYANERLSSARVQQAEQALRNFHAKTGQLYNSSPNGYNHGAHYLHQDLEAPRMRAMDLMSATGSSSWNTPRSLIHGDYECGLRDSSGRFRTGYSLGESLPRSTIIKAQQRARSRAYTASACSCHLQDSYMFPARANYLSTEFGNLGLSNYHSRPSSRMWGNGGYNTSLRRSSSGTALAGYGCAY